MRCFWPKPLMHNGPALHAQAHVAAKKLLAVWLYIPPNGVGNCPRKHCARGRPEVTRECSLSVTAGSQSKRALKG